MNLPESSPCAPFADDLGTLAAGALTGRQRAAVLMHVEHCPECAVELESLSASADALLQLYPELDPDDGFAERVIDRIRAEEAAHRRRPRMRLALAAAAVVVLLGFVGGLAAVFVPGNQPVAGPAVSATLQSPIGAHGMVSLTSGRNAWLVMTLDGHQATGMVTCRVTLTDGSSRVVGQFQMRHGYGSWSVPLTVPSSSVRSVTVLDAHGATVASATL